MRLLVVVLLAAVPATAEDLLPREGSGWTGFKTGTWVRIKRTSVQQGKLLTPTITRSTLAKADERQLTIESVSENALGMRTDDKQVVPASGEAGPGETEKVEGLGEEEVIVGGRPLACARTKTTVKGPSGTRIITTWVAKEPRAWAKRTETTLDADGKEVSRATLLLTSLAEDREVGGRRIRCLKYRTVRRDGEIETEGDAYMSREVPGGLAWMETEIRQKGVVVLTMRVEALEFEAK